jgi:HK97 family phage major capsid protein
MSTTTETEKFKDEAIKAVREAMGGSLEDAVEHAIEKSYAGREAALEAKLDGMLRAKTAVNAWEEVTEKRSPIGVAVAAVALHKDNRSAAIETATKILGPNVSKTINLSEASEGGVLVRGDALSQWFEALKPTTAVLALNPVNLPMPNRSMEVPGFTGRPSFSWVGEVNADEIDSTPSTGMRKLNAKKGMALVEITNSMLGTTVGPAIAKFVEGEATREVGIGLDTAYLRGAGTDHTPKGARWWAGLTTAMTATPTLTTSFTDFRNALTKLSTNNAPMSRLSLIWNPRTELWLKLGALDGFNRPFWMEEMKGGTLLGMPFKSTNNVPTNLGGGTESELYMLDMEHLLVGTIADGGIRVEYFKEGSFVSGGSTRSLMQRDTQAVRLVVETDINVRYANAHHITTGLTWGA